MDISLNTQLLDIFKVALAAALGAVLGYERQQHQKPARINDHVLVSAGACLFTVAGLAFAEGDASRVAANVVTGIGFLGAGVILRGQSGGVSGVTTAASIWMVAAIGLAVGVGLYLVAAFTAIGGFLLLWTLHQD